MSEIACEISAYRLLLPAFNYSCKKKCNFEPSGVRFLTFVRVARGPILIPLANLLNHVFLGLKPFLPDSTVKFLRPLKNNNNSKRKMLFFYSSWKLGF